MKNSTWIKGGLALVALAFGMSTAAATESGFYVGLNLGQSTFDIEDDVEEFFGTTDGLDDSDTAWSLAMGYRFVPQFALEASYVDMGEASLSQSGVENFGFGTVYSYSDSLEASLSGLALAMVAAIPSGGFEFNFKLGLMFAKTEFSTSGSESVTYSGFPAFSQTYSGSESASTTEMLYGLGAGYTFGDHFHLRLDWMKVPDAGDEDETGEDDVSSLTVGVQYRF